MVAFQENITGNGLFRKNSKNLQKISGDGRLFPSIAAVADQNLIKLFC